MQLRILWTTWLTVILSGSTFAQVTPLPIEKVDSAMSAEAKPLLILLSTDWCKYCQTQKKILSKQQGFVEKGHLFYYIEFDAESKHAITFHGQTYAFQPSGKSTGVHELAVALNGPGRLAFPTWVVLDEAYQILFRHGGVLTQAHIIDLLETISNYKRSN